MSKNIFTGHHDFAESSDIRREAAINQELLEAKFIRDLNQFRSEALYKLHTHDALEHSVGEGWGVFSNYEIENESEEAMFLPGGKSTLLLATNGKPNPSNGNPVPKIRIITNELIRTPDKCQWLTQDFSADKEDHAQYMVDVVDVNNQRVDETLAPLFVVDDESRLNLSINTCAFTPSFGVKLEGRPDTMTAPFGDYENLEDKIHALSAGQALLEEVMNIEPEHIAPFSS